jgi:hypothetical protein
MQEKKNAHMYKRRFCTAEPLVQAQKAETAVTLVVSHEPDSLLWTIFRNTTYNVFHAKSSIET